MLLLSEAFSYGKIGGYGRKLDNAYVKSQIGGSSSSILISVIIVHTLIDRCIRKVIRRVSKKVTVRRASDIRRIILGIALVGFPSRRSFCELIG